MVRLQDTGWQGMSEAHQQTVCLLAASLELLLG